jgi:hypothetical protein
MARNHHYPLRGQPYVYNRYYIPPLHILVYVTTQIRPLSCRFSEYRKRSFSGKNSLSIRVAVITDYEVENGESLPALVGPRADSACSTGSDDPHLAQSLKDS